jgi:hypothetical protein
MDPSCGPDFALLPSPILFEAQLLFLKYGFLPNCLYISSVGLVCGAPACCLLAVLLVMGGVLRVGAATKCQAGGSSFCLLFGSAFFPSLASLAPSQTQRMSFLPREASCV